MTCKKLDKKLSGQVMGNLPGAVKKRTTSKVYWVIFNFIGTRAAYLELVPDYSTESFLMVLRRFVSLIGYP